MMFFSAAAKYFHLMTLKNKSIRPEFGIYNKFKTRKINNIKFFCKHSSDSDKLAYHRPTTTMYLDSYISLYDKFTDLFISNILYFIAIF